MEAERQRAETFLDQMQAMKDVDEPARLAQRARTDLEQLLETLNRGQITGNQGWEKLVKLLPKTLEEVIRIAGNCIAKIKGLQKRGRGK